jgi:uncharacterized protein YbjQ (UPF0145 family)
MNLDETTLLMTVALVAMPLVLGLVVGGMQMRAHRRELERREREVADLVTVDLDEWPGPAPDSGQMVLGQVVLGCDHFRALLGKLANLIGGEVRSFSSLYERARREALLRLKEEARRSGAEAVLNVRFDTSSIGSSRGGIMVEVLASGTAVRWPRA